MFVCLFAGITQITRSRAISPRSMQEVPTGLREAGVDAARARLDARLRLRARLLVSAPAPARPRPHLLAVDGFTTTLMVQTT